MADEIVARFFSSGFPARDPGPWERVYRTFLATDPDGYIACCEALATSDLSEEVGAISVPSLIIGGTEDVSTPPELAESLHAAIPHSELEIIAGAGHLSNMDTPDVFNDRLERFLASA
jgi:3-oxoadipate enol-lactonase